MTSIAGAWELVSEYRRGLIVATETFATALLTAAARQRFAGEEPTEVEEAEAYRTFVAQGGRYTIAGTRLIHHRAYTRNPNSTGTDEEFDFRIDGELLVLQSVDTDGTRGAVMTWRKVG